MTGSPTDAALRTGTRRMLLHVLPPLLLGYAVLLFDRAALAFVGRDVGLALGLTPFMVGLGTPILFLGVLFFEVPGALLAARLGSRRWLGLVLLALAAAALVTATATGPVGFYAGRIAAAAAGAVYFPVALFLVAGCIPARVRTRTMASFLLASLSIPVAAPFLGPALAAAAAGSGFEAWRLLFAAIATLFALAAGLLVLLVPRRPDRARFLSPAQNDALSWSRAMDARPPRGGARLVHLADPHLLLLAGIATMLSVSTFAASTWLTVLTNDSRAPLPLIGLAFVGATGLVTFAWAWRADRTGRLAGTMGIACTLATVGYAAAILPSLMLTALAGLLGHAVALGAARTMMWSLGSRLALAGGGPAALAVLDAAGLIGAFVAPRVVAGAAESFGSLQLGLLVLATVPLGAALACWTIRSLPARD